MIHYRPMTPHETVAVCHLVAHVFSATVAPLFEPTGVAEFLQYLTPHELVKRLQHEHEVWVAEQAGKIVGVIEVRDGNHISLFFVDQTQQGRGIGRRLLKTAITACHQHNPTLTSISVHATPNAVPIYTHLGFQAVASEQVDRGMRYLPMTLDLATWDKQLPNEPTPKSKLLMHQRRQNNE
jgi:GNAT superfamily N-acetyltransferase